MSRRGVWILVLVLGALGAAWLLAVIGLPLLGLGIIFRKEIAREVSQAWSRSSSGTRLVYEWHPPEGTTPADAQEVMSVIEKRIDPDGWSGCVVRPVGTNRLEILVSDRQREAGDMDRVKRLVRQAGFLEFRIVVEKVKDREKANFDEIVRLKKAGKLSSTPQFRWYPLERGYEWHKDGLLDAWNFVYVVDAEHQTVEALVDVADGQDVTGRDLSRAFASTQEGVPIVSFTLKPTAGARFARLTRPENRNRHLAIILDGVIKSAPVLRATLSMGGIIEGYRNHERDRDEVLSVLNSGPLGVRLDLVEETRFGNESPKPKSITE